MPPTMIPEITELVLALPEQGKEDNNNNDQFKLLCIIIKIEY
jgi:hypothetical protein